MGVLYFAAANAFNGAEIQFLTRSIAMLLSAVLIMWLLSYRIVSATMRRGRNDRDTYGRGGSIGETATIATHDEMTMSSRGGNASTLGGASASNGGLRTPSADTLATGGRSDHMPSLGASQATILGDGGGHSTGSLSNVSTLANSDNALAISSTLHSFSGSTIG